MCSFIGFPERILPKTMYTINIGQNQYQSCTYKYIYSAYSTFLLHHPRTREEPSLYKLSKSKDIDFYVYTTNQLRTYIETNSRQS